MSRSPARRGTRAVALALLTMAALLAGACGKDGSGGPTDPIPNDPDPSDPTGPAEWPAPVGYTVYAVDIENNFLTFGTESFDVLSGAERSIRASDPQADHRHRLSAVGRQALWRGERQPGVHHQSGNRRARRPVSETRFSPKIVDFFEIHFAMALEPNGDRVRLISTRAAGAGPSAWTTARPPSGAPMQFVGGRPARGRDAAHRRADVRDEPAAGVRMRGCSISDPCDRDVCT